MRGYERRRLNGTATEPATAYAAAAPATYSSNRSEPIQPTAPTRQRQTRRETRVQTTTYDAVCALLRFRPRWRPPYPPHVLADRSVVTPGFLP